MKKSLIEKFISCAVETDLEIPDVVIDSAYSAGNKYVDNSKNVKCKRIIVRFTKFRHRTRFYHAKKKFKKVTQG